MEQFARAQGSLRSGEEIIRQRNRCNESRGVIVFTFRGKGNALRIRGLAGILAEACFGVVARTSSRAEKFAYLRAGDDEGGRRRNVKSWVQLINKPRRMASLDEKRAFDGGVPRRSSGLRRGFRG